MAVLALLLAGCGSANGPNTTDSDQATDQTTKTSAVTRDGEQARITITTGDEMEFDITEFTVAPEEKVTLTLKHTGQESRQRMGHNLVILPRDTQPMTFATSVQGEGGNLDNDYLPSALAEEVIVHTELIGGGEEDTVTFKAPQTPGQYPFVCTAPGHVTTEQGTLIVESK
jgi:azurin